MPYYNFSKNIEIKDILFSKAEFNLNAESIKSFNKLLFTDPSEYKITIKDNPNRLDQLISDCLLQFPEDDFDSVLVQGDTASAFACAVAAFNRKKKIYYFFTVKKIQK